MKKVILPLLAFLSMTFLPITSYTQNMQFGWSHVLGTAGNNMGKSILADDEGYLYVAGEFFDDFSFGDSILYGPGLSNVFLVKLNSMGELIWVRSFGGTGQVKLRGMAFDQEMNLVCTGSYSLILSVNDTAIESNGGSDIFILRLDTSGDWIGIHSDGGTGDEYAIALDIDQTGNILVAGSFRGESAFGNVSLTSSGEWIWTPWGNQFVFIENPLLLKYGPGFECAYAKKISRKYGQLCAIASDSQENIYVSGYFSSADSLVDTTASEIGKFMVFKYNASGQLTGFIQEGSGNNYIKGNALAVDSQDNLYAAGYIGCTGCVFGDSLLPESYNDAFLVKYDPQGGMQWINLIGQYNGDYDGNENSAKALAIDEEDNVYLAGYYDGIVWNGIEIIGTNSGLDFLVVKTHPDGMIANIGAYGYPSWDSGEGICLDHEGKICITGYTYLDGMSTEYPSYIFITKVDSLLPVAVPEAQMAGQVKAYPNPTKGNVTIDLPEGMNYPATFSVISLDGKTIYESRINCSHVEIDLSGQEPGLYCLKVKSAGGIYCRNLIKLH